MRGRGAIVVTGMGAVSALGAGNQAIGNAPTLTNKVIAPKNAVTNLGTLSIAITGQ